MNPAIPEADLLSALASFVRDLGHYPVRAELKLRRRQDPDFPSWNVFERLGGKAEVASRLISHLADDPEWGDVVAIATPIAADVRPPEPEDDEQALAGEVYLVKSGSHYKIGRSNAAGRRAYELAIQLPERLEVVHVIETDDAVGIERYWHGRFAHRRLNGEWFALSSADVAAFKRRKRFM
jgi:hypothetical protein